MPGGFGTPFREPCGGWPAQLKLHSSCYQHGKKSDRDTPAWSNTTTVADYHSPPGAAVPPYPRLAHSGVSPDDWGNCTAPGQQGDCPACEHSPPPECGGTGMKQCGPWPDAAKPTCPSPDSSHDTIDSNCYLKLGTTVDRSACRMIGFKNVQAIKQWHGTFGYMSHDRSATQLSTPWVNNDRSRLLDLTCGECSIEYEQTSADYTKYLQLALSCTITDTGPGGTSHSSAVTIAVDRYSGVRTISGCTSDATSDPIMNGHYGAGQLDLLSLWDTWVPLYPNSCPTGTDCSYATGSGVTLDFKSYDACINNGGGPGGGCSTGGNILAHITLDLSAGTGDFYQYDYVTHSAPVGPVDLIYEEHWTFSSTGFTHTQITYEHTAGVFIGTRTVTVTGTLSSPYTATNLYSDVCGLLNEWDLSDNATYQWRTDPYCSVAPLVSYNETAAQSPDHAPTSGACADAAAALPKPSLAAGSVIGTPTPDGAPGAFDWDHKTWKQCVDGLGAPHVYLYEYGAWSGEQSPPGAASGDITDFYMTPSATQWTENYPLPGQLPAGAWVFYKNPATALMAQKWAEIKVPRPSWNFARPCGADRYNLEETSVVCVASASGTGPYTLTLALASPGTSNGDTVLVCGVSGVPSGFYVASGISGTSVTVTGPTTVSPSWTAPKDCIAPGFFGKVRFVTAPAICGRIAVSNATNANPIQISADPNWLQTGDSVTISGVTGNTAANGTFTVTVIDKLNFTLNSTTGNGAYTGGGFVVSASGGTDYSWNDDQAKGQFVYVEFQCSMRDWQERNRVNNQYTVSCDSCAAAAPASTTPIRHNQTLHGMPQQVNNFIFSQQCLSWDVCNPQVMCVTPNGETFPNGYVVDFPSRSSPPNTVLADERYGTQWQAGFIQHMEDLLWEPPHKPCVVGLSANRPTLCGFSEDDGHCFYGLDGAAAGGKYCGNCIESGDTVTSSDSSPPALFYAHRPFVECLCAVPTKATSPTSPPSLPSGIYIAFATLTDLDTAGSVTKVIVLPPNPPGYPTTAAGSVYEPNQFDMPWNIYLAEIGCMCNQGCFATDYALNVAKVNCP